MQVRSRRRFWLQLLAVVLVSAVVLAYLLAFATRHGFFDLKIYRGAVRYWAAGGELYRYIYPRTIYGFTYPPFAAITMLPMSLFTVNVTASISSVGIALGITVLAFWLFGPIAQRHGLSRWFVVALAVPLLCALDPIHETMAFGQVNVFLLAVVAFDVLFGVARGRRWGGILIGLATAVKLTPGIFIVYLLVTRRWRAAITASAAAAAATLLAAAVMPHESWVFWTDAIWHTDRIGRIDFVSNQSVAGLIARAFDHAYATGWVLLPLTLAVLAVWFVKSRRAVFGGDEVAGLALTGLCQILVSPISWIHHLTWAVPAFAVLFGGVLDARDRRRRLVLGGVLVVSFLVLASSLPWVRDVTVKHHHDWGVWGVLIANSYGFVMLAMLLAIPVRDAFRTRGDRPPAVGELLAPPPPWPWRRGSQPVAEEPAPSAEEGRPAAEAGRPPAEARKPSASGDPVSTSA